MTGRRRFELLAGHGTEACARRERRERPGAKPCPLCLAAESAAGLRRKQERRRRDAA